MVHDDGILLLPFAVLSSAACCLLPCLLSSIDGGVVLLFVHEHLQPACHSGTPNGTLEVQCFCCSTVVVLFCCSTWKCCCSVFAVLSIWYWCSGVLQRSCLLLYSMVFLPFDDVNDIMAVW